MDKTVAGRTLAPILQLQGVTRSFRQGPREIVVLQGVDVALWPGQAVALVGPSGAGKSTLLHITGLLESPTSGRVIVNGRDCATLSESERTRLRRTEIGFVYQFHQLLPEFSALENVVIPQLILGRSRKAAEARARALLTNLGLGDKIEHRPARTFRRRTTAHPHLPRPRQWAETFARRRADRKPRSAHVRARLPRVDRAHSPSGRCRAHCHPQHGNSHGAWTGCCRFRTAGSLRFQRRRAF